MFFGNSKPTDSIVILCWHTFWNDWCRYVKHYEIWKEWAEHTEIDELSASLIDE